MQRTSTYENTKNRRVWNHEPELKTIQFFFLTTPILKFVSFYPQKITDSPPLTKLKECQELKNEGRDDSAHFGALISSRVSDGIRMEGF